jgi:UDP-N-acetylmuramoylalanine--D-glutamate ligase
MIDLQNKKVAVAGLDHPGVAACLFLQAQGAKVVALQLDHPPAPAENLARLKAAHIPVLAVTAMEGGKLDLVVHSSGVSRHSPALQPLIRAGVEICSDLELAHPKFCCLSVAIAGTNGKSTTADLLEKILTQTGRKTVKSGGSDLPVCEAAGLSRDLDFLVLEVNSFQLESIRHFRPTVAVLLNLKPDHMDQYDRMSNYVTTVAQLFRNQQPFDWAILQTEALAHLRSLNIEIPGKIITFSANNRRADIILDRGLLISQLDGWSGPLFNLDHTRLQGPHNAENIMAALAVGRVLRVPLEEMVPAVKEYIPGPHRLELVSEINGVKFVNNSKAMNVDAVAQSIEAVALARSADANIWLIAGGKDKGLNYHDLGPLLARRVKGAFLLGETREKLRAAWGLFTPCTLVNSLLEAVSKATENASEGDVVLLSPACSSFDMFQNYQHRGEAFRQAVEQVANSRKDLPSFEPIPAQRN